MNWYSLKAWLLPFSYRHRVCSTMREYVVSVKFGHQMTLEILKAAHSCIIAIINWLFRPLLAKWCFTKESDRLHIPSTISQIQIGLPLLNRYMRHIIISLHYHHGKFHCPIQKYKTQLKFKEENCEDIKDV